MNKKRLKRRDFWISLEATTGHIVNQLNMISSYKKYCGRNICVNYIYWLYYVQYMWLTNMASVKRRIC
jgi:hypothetical protein